MIYNHISIWNTQRLSREKKFKLILRKYGRDRIHSWLHDCKMHQPFFPRRRAASFSYLDSKRPRNVVAPRRKVHSRHSIRLYTSRSLFLGGGQCQVSESLAALKLGVLNNGWICQYRGRRRDLECITYSHRHHWRNYPTRWCKSVPRACLKWQGTRGWWRRPRNSLARAARR